MYMYQSIIIILIIVLLLLSSVCCSGSLLIHSLTIGVSSLFSLLFSSGFIVVFVVVLLFCLTVLFIQVLILPAHPQNSLQHHDAGTHQSTQQQAFHFTVCPSPTFPIYFPSE